MDNLHMISREPKSGFTLIEAIVTLVIIAAVTIVVVALLTDHFKTLRRLDAENALVSISMAQDRYHSTHATYGTLSDVWGNVSSSEEGYYTLTITNISATGYTLTATSKQSSDRESDGTDCKVMSLVMNRGMLTKSPAICWPAKLNTTEVMATER